MTLSTKEIIALGEKHLLGNVTRIPLALVRGQGTKVWDAEGKEYLDFIAGIATCAFGHSPPFAAKVIAEQATILWHVSNLFWNEPMVRLAEKLTKVSGLDRAFFCNSGAEANEGAIKMARKYSLERFGSGRHTIIAANNSFHGRTMGALSATGQETLRAPFEPLVPGFTFVPYGDFEALEKSLDKSVCAVILEPVQGEGGVVVPPMGYLKAVSDVCRKNSILLILDEIQTGLGRTGLEFAFKHFDLKPDIITLGKALGCGYPAGALVADALPASALTPGSHSTTLGGAPLAMALGLELVNNIVEPTFLAEVRQKGKYFLDGLKKLAEKIPVLKDARGLGLMLGASLTKPAGPVANNLRDHGFLVNATATTVLRFVPPLTVSLKEIDLLLEALEAALKEVYPEETC
ncbi:MAG: aspartate aminotransferase family protein [Deltaproteobacteria bacterium]|jgi:predicted acetylornithine/succinylornithine family transaminase|nr:aspartate aminotransferase family protein [Deltaproteobacteria bacterium]